MLKAYKYRIYPNSEQRIQIAKTFGCCRFVYNQTLAHPEEVVILHIGKKYTRKRKSQLVKRIVIITVTEN